MTKKEQSELQQLNQKFDVLIGLLTPKTTEPVVRQSEERTAPSQEIVAPDSLPLHTPKTVKLHVTPCITIAGIEYGGNVEVPEGIASQLRHMMNKWQAYERKTQTFVDHGTRDHGVM